MNKRIVGFAFVFVCLFAVSSVSAQDFHKSYELGAGGRIRVGNISGDVIVTGYDGSAVVITGTKEGRDKDIVQVEDLSTPGSIDVKVRYPRDCHNCDASIKFEVKVPRSISYEFDKISSVSGEVEISNVTGNLRASSVSGTVKIREASGSVNASSVSGEVDVEIRQLAGTENMKFSSVSGSVDVKLPGNLDADVQMSTMSGDLKTDFPIEIKKRGEYEVGRRASGRLGSGSRSLHLSSVSGSISLTRF